MRFEVDPEALLEAEEAARWYADKSPALGADFAAAIEEVFAEIRKNPQRYGVLPRPTRRVEIRAGLTRRFPYLVLYFAVEDRVRVVAVMHASRRPDYWSDRLSDEDAAKDGS